jgi:hypothetical protein
MKGPTHLVASGLAAPTRRRHATLPLVGAAPLAAVMGPTPLTKVASASPNRQRPALSGASFHCPNNNVSFFRLHGTLPAGRLLDAEGCHLNHNRVLVPLPPSYSERMRNITFPPEPHDDPICLELAGVGLDLRARAWARELLAHVSPAWFTPDLDRQSVQPPRCHTD